MAEVVAIRWRDGRAVGLHVIGHRQNQEISVLEMARLLYVSIVPTRLIPKEPVWIVLEVIKFGDLEFDSAQPGKTIHRYAQ